MLDLNVFSTNFQAFDYPEIAGRLTFDEMRRATEITKKYG